ncbi:MAG: FtsW/RodA/SpoVE family cell cycle protein [Oscillospiraceae bacterium]
MMVLAVVCLGAFVVRLRLPSDARQLLHHWRLRAAISILMVQTILNVMGTVDLLPLTGVTFPFVSNGGSSMISLPGGAGLYQRRRIPGRMPALPSVCRPGRRRP